jgi:formyltetrahydrofolate deformylase
VNRPEFVLTLAGPDRVGIVHAVSGFLAEQGCTILDSQQFGDPATHRFFARMHFAAAHELTTRSTLRHTFSELAAAFGLDWSLHESSRRDRVLVLVSAGSNILDDLLHRQRTGALPGDIVAIAADQSDCQPAAEAAGVAFHALRMSAGVAGEDVTPEREQALRDLIEAVDIDLVVLGGYQHALSAKLCADLAGRVIGVQRSFGPALRPDASGDELRRGAKLISATAYYASADSDEAPIIEQDVARIDHATEPEQLMAASRDLQTAVLGRAVTWHLEHRVLVNGTKTVVFR